MSKFLPIYYGTLSRWGFTEKNLQLRKTAYILRYLMHFFNVFKVIWSNKFFGSKSKNGICALSFNTAAQLRKHRSLKGHVGLGRGRSVISQLLKCGLQPVKARGTD